MDPGQDLRSVVRASSLAELAWLSEPGTPDARGVVALEYDGNAAIAFTYADVDTARSVAASPEAVLTLTETRSTGGAFRPTRFRSRPRLVEDPEGDFFAEHLLEQELRRYPPSRALADSPLLRRENWWYVPRLVVLVDPADRAELPAREGPRDHVLAVATDDGLTATVVTVAAETEDRLTLRVLGPEPDPGEAVLLGQDAVFPDLERWSHWRFRGTWDGLDLHVREKPESVGLPPVPTVWQRLRRQRDLSRRCRAGLGA